MTLASESEVSGAMPRSTHSSIPASCMVQTPPSLAAAIIQCLGDTHESYWLEPSCGEGVFLRALRDAGVSRSRITGVDLIKGDKPADTIALVERGHDFLLWSTRRRANFDRVVGNPPFVRMSSLEHELRKAALQRVEHSGIPVAGTSNYWLPFLIASIECLRRGGSLGFILPAAWDYASYAKPLRESIGDMFAEVEVHRSRRSLFPGRQDGNVVLICRGYGTGKCAPSRAEHEDATALCRALAGRGHDSSPKIHSRANRKQLQVSSPTVPAHSVFSTRIGAVTGDVKYFLLTEDQRRELDLPVTCLCKAVTRASQIRSSEIDGRAWQKLRDSGGRVWLFYPSSESLDLTAVRRYLENGACDRSRLKISTRDHWYRTPLPATAHGFISGMSKESPWVCLNRAKGLTATNTLYVVEFRERTTIDERASWGLALLHPSTRSAVRSASRVYGAGLRKLEPSDIANLPLPIPATTEGALGTYREALDYLLEGNPERSERIAADWFWRGH